MNSDRLVEIFRLIDAANALDPTVETWQGQRYPAALLYGHRMSERLEQFRPDAGEELRIAARGQHLRRWEVPRGTYPEGREGYLRWRTFLYDFHAAALAELMQATGYPPPAIDRVRTLVRKRGLRTDPDVQWIEDTACLVFLEFYLEAFAAGHDPSKLAGIIRKTWKKMSADAQAAALGLPFSEPVASLLRETLATL